MYRRRTTLLAYLALAPSAILSAGVIFYPILRTFWAAFCQVDRKGNPQAFGTLDNFRALLGSEVFCNQVVPHTLLWTGAVVGVTIAISLFVALALNERLPGRRLMRALVMLPWATSLVISAAVWRWTLHPTQGPLNRLLEDWGLMPYGQAPAWLARPGMALAAVIAVGIWVSIPFTSVVLLAGLQSIEDSVYEAGLLDGATGWRRLRYLTLPLLRPVLLVVVLLNVIYVVNSFPIIWTLTEGGPANQTHIIVTYLYQTAISQREYGQGYAMAVLTFIALLAFSIIYLRLQAREGLAGE
ncbi:MAG: sugar ABC transporter permease [Armatimonadetes bacterium]|nr:sugar ABC transporter permease [Armatimonadota bacterium]